MRSSHFVLALLSFACTSTVMVQPVRAFDLAKVSASSSAANHHVSILNSLSSLAQISASAQDIWKGATTVDNDGLTISEEPAFEVEAMQDVANPEERNMENPFQHVSASITLTTS